MRIIAGAAFGGLVAVALLAPGTSARAGDDDDNPPLDTRILRGLMDQLGLKQDGPGIDYHERAPLVLPPSHDLPPPEKSDAAVSSNPAWPVDPDVQRAKQEAAARRKVSSNPEEVLLKEQRPLRPDELAPGPKPRGTARRTDDGYRAPPDGVSGPLPPSQLGSNGNFFSKMFGKDDPTDARFTGEPARAELTDPPPGYQTPSPDQPYGVGKKAGPQKPANYLATHGMLEGTN